MALAVILLMALGAAPQTGSDVCTGSNDYRDCRTADGGTFIERRLGSSIVRRGTDKEGRTWTEYVTPVFDGSRVEGVDSNGHSWSQQCNPRLGRTGTNRNGNTIFQPPQPQGGGQGRAHLETACD